MSLIKDFSTEMFKYSKKVVNKTDILAQLAKLNIDVEKKKREITKTKTQIGDYIVEQHDKNEQPNEDILQSKIEKISEIRSEMDQIKNKIESLKSQLWEAESKNKESSNEETKNEDINGSS